MFPLKCETAVKRSYSITSTYFEQRPLQAYSTVTMFDMLLVLLLSEHVAPYKKLRGGVAFIDEIPKSASGKILRKELQKIEQTNRHTEILASKL